MYFLYFIICIFFFKPCSKKNYIVLSILFIVGIIRKDNVSGWREKICLDTTTIFLLFLQVNHVSTIPIRIAITLKVTPLYQYISTKQNLLIKQQLNFLQLRPISSNFVYRQVLCVLICLVYTMNSFRITIILLMMLSIVSKQTI